MRSLTRLWLAIEDISDLVALPAVWAEKCGSEDFVHIERFLSPTKDRAGRYPCPYPAGYNCPRLIVGVDGGPFEALCQDPHKICPDLSLSLKDALLHELDLFGLIEPMLKVAGIRNPQFEPRAPGVWNVGLAVGGDPTLQPAYLLVFAGAEEFAAAALPLAYKLNGPFTIVAPTVRHWTGTLREKLPPPRITVIALNDRVGLDDSGGLIALRTQPPDDLFQGARAGKLLAVAEQGGSDSTLLFCVPVLCQCGRRRMEHRPAPFEEENRDRLTQRGSDGQPKSWFWVI